MPYAWRSGLERDPKVASFQVFGWFESKSSRMRTHAWEFQSRFRKGALGWRGSSAAVDRLNKAIAEIKRAQRGDPVLAAEGAIKLLGRISPAFEHVDSSSGALGSAVRGTIRELVPVIATAPVEMAERRKWLELLWKAYQDDEIPYIESLGEYWGELCASPELASAWADRLIPLVRDSFKQKKAESRYVPPFHGTEACFSALFAADRFDEIFDLLEATSSRWWGYRCWAFRGLVARGQRAEALRYAEGSREPTGNCDRDISRACEQLLLQSGMAEEAYRRYGIAAAGWEPTYLGRFRALASKYPTKSKADILRDLMASTPGDEGKWFAAAKAAGLYDEAIALVQASPCDPKTLGRAARDFAQKRPAFALEAALAALRWCAAGYGYEVTAVDISQAYGCGLRAAEQLARSDEFRNRVIEIDGPSNAFVRKAIQEA
jgi:hypothetical protein